MPRGDYSPFLLYVPRPFVNVFFFMYLGRLLIFSYLFALVDYSSFILYVPRVFINRFLFMCLGRLLIIFFFICLGRLLFFSFLCASGLC